MTTAGAAERDAATSRDRARRAWLVLGAGFLAFTLSAGIMHAYTVFLLAFVAEFGWTRAEASIAYSVGQVVAGASSPLVGGMVDRLGSRRMVLLGGCLLALGLVLSASARSLWQVVALYGVVMTVGANCVGMVVFVPLVSRLFAARRGMAISVLQSANGLGRAVSAPAAQLLVGGMGWRGAYLLLAGTLAALPPPLARLFPRREREPPAADGAGAAVREWTLAEAARTWRFWVLGLVYMLTSIGSFLVSLHQLAFAVGIGFDPLYAAGVLGMGAFLALPGVIATGTLSDRFGREAAAVATYFVSIPRGGLRAVHRRPFAALAALAARLPVRRHLGRARAGHHGQDGGPVLGPAARHDPGRHHRRLGARGRDRQLGGRAAVRPHRRLSARLLALDGGLRAGLRGLLDAAAAGGGLTPAPAPPPGHLPGQGGDPARPTPGPHRPGS